MDFKSYTKQIRDYLTQDLNSDEKKAYINYIKGNEKSNIWIEKTLNRREPLLLKNIKCDTCHEWVHIKETGLCKCINSHNCYNEVIKNLPKKESIINKCS
jgi:hypothetical protein